MDLEADPAAWVDHSGCMPADKGAEEKRGHTAPERSTHPGGLHFPLLRSVIFFYKLLIKPPPNFFLLCNQMN